MEFKIDINDTINKSVGVSTKFAEFWRGMTFPSNIGAALSFLVVLAVLPFVGSILKGFIPQPYFVPFGGMFWVWMPVYGIIAGVFWYIYFVGAPIVLGAIMGALDKPLNINKGDANSYTTIVAYSYAPAAIGFFLTFIPFIGFLFGLLGILSLVAVYLGLTVALGLDSGQAVIMLVVSGLIAMVIFFVFFGILFGLNMAIAF
ncbi:MAG TPA: YIP1 family protein [Acidobacteriota bacterium]|nr:YIP1 family protein [Acidobacteriota bacterium]